MNLRVEGPYKKFVDDAQKAFNSMKTRKAAGPSGMTSDLLKVCGDETT